MLRALLANDTSLIGHHGSAIVVDRLVALARDAGIALERGHGWKAIEARTDFSRYDLVIVNGEGSLHHDARTARRIARLIARVGPELPVTLLNTLAEELDPALLAELKAARRIVARDGASAAALRAAGLAATSLPDVTMTLAPPPLAGGGGLAFTDSVRPEIDSALGHAAAMTGGVVLRFDAMPGPDRADPLRLKRLRRRIAIRRRPAGHDIAIARTADFVAFLARDVSGLVSGRFHGVCLALRLGLPFLAVASNTSKIEALLDEVGMRRRLIAPERLNGGGAPTPPPFDGEEEARRARFLDHVERGWADLMAEIAADARRSHT